MTDEEALLRAVIADPDDDAPRLIYADWLDEQGKADRAEFIRVQCALQAAPPGDPRRPAWLDREVALLNDREDEWLGRLRWLFYLWAFRRGFLEEVTLKAPTFLDNAAALFRAAPVRLVRLLKTDGVVDRLANCPQLRRVAALHLTGNGIGDPGATALAASPNVAGLVTLRLGGNGIGDRG
ncbi:MAG TPA: TIGR02996 domain-containing protein, partial [Gemmataceae bacterium]|nr:TIGR02996 domain-containing protein [Gemmataceae bacterium]